MPKLNVKPGTIIFRGSVEQPKRYSFDTSEFIHADTQVWVAKEYSQRELLTIKWTFHKESQVWYSPHFEMRHDKVDEVMEAARFLAKLCKNLPRNEWGNVSDGGPTGYLEALKAIKAVEVVYDDRTGNLEPLTALMPASLSTWRDDWQRVPGAHNCHEWVNALDEEQAKLKMVSVLAAGAANSNSNKEYFEAWGRAGCPLIIVSNKVPDSTPFKAKVAALNTVTEKALQIA